MSLDTHQLSPTPPGAGIAANNADVIAAITGHHTTLVNEMRTLTAAVVDGARSGRYDQALSALMAWFTREFLPHAHAEEVALYKAGSHLESTRLLVDGMLAEHRAIESLMTDLTYARDPFTVIAATAAARAVFTVHLSKENELLLPALDAEAVDLEQALTGKLEILGESSAPDELDVRSLPHGGRHDVIFAKLNQLLPGDTFVILNDHDPKPLRYQTAALWPGRFAWSYLEAGPLLWRVEITRAD
jgi:uncharacterized protein (DUF2249 family)/hemerythrin-like domain-containing protein